MRWCGVRAGRGIPVHRTGGAAGSRCRVPPSWGQASPRTREGGAGGVPVPEKGMREFRIPRHEGSGKSQSQGKGTEGTGSGRMGVRGVPVTRKRGPYGSPVLRN